MSRVIFLCFCQADVALVTACEQNGGPRSDVLTVRDNMNAVNPYSESTGHSYPYFPSRNLVRQKSASGGAWLVEWKGQQEERFKALLAPAKHDNQNKAKRQAPRSKLAVAVTQSLTKSFIIDNFVCYVKDPSALCSINLRGRSLHQSYNNEDFSCFNCVVHIDASENHLSLESLKTFPSVSEVDLQLNGLTQIVIGNNDFPALSFLDLSYNSIQGESIVELGALPSLKSLYLCSNGLRKLPNLDTASNDRLKRVGACFPSLKVLHLDDNYLTEMSSFLKLSSLASLQVLSLAGNRIVQVPHSDELDLYSDGQWTVDQSEANVLNQSMTSVRHDVSMATIEPSRQRVDEFSGYNDSRGSQACEYDAVPVAHRQQGLDASKFVNGNTLQRRRTNVPGEDIYFPNVTCLDLSRNRIIKEEAVLGLAQWPSLRKLVLHGNPIAASSRELPPLIQNHLSKACGIEIVRSERTKGIKRLPIARKVSNSFQRRTVMDPLPPIRRMDRKWRPLPASAPPLSIEHHPDDTPSAMAISVHETEGEFNVRRQEWEQTSNNNGCDPSSKTMDDEGVTSKQGRKGNVFLTQLDDAVNFEDEVNTSDVDARHRFMHTTISKDQDPFTEKDPKIRKYKGYEELLTTTEDDLLLDDSALPKTLNGTIRELTHSLQHPLVYCHPSKKQGNHTWSKMVKQPSRIRKAKKSPAAEPKSNTTSEQLSRALERMRTDPMLLEESLDRVLSSKDKSLRNKFPNGQQLMNQVQKKYNEVRARSMKAIVGAKNTIDLAAKQDIEISTAKLKQHDPISQESKTSEITLESIRQKVESRL